MPVFLFDIKGRLIVYENSEKPTNSWLISSEEIDLNSIMMNRVFSPNSHKSTAI